ncbi:chromobox protein homolog 3 [Parasteatoda tepidariorum]|uniref:chromobox protein homolog 3 n=1 Tax=Parasteatoda tepidariorum TaxID=114398 RepID=UPI00077F86F8|nr:chromobox protein homolog 3 [Parasteatoda tepidariorum]
MSKKGKKEQIEEEPEEYTVEKILDKRITNGKVEYFLKWTGFPDSENTWEPVENLDCPELIRKFEEDYKKRGGKAVEDKSGVDKKRKANGEPDVVPKKKIELKGEETPKKEDRLRGFDRGCEPDRIIGATDSGGELMFLIKWKGCDEADLVSSKVANVKCPQVVIKFYEERLTWHTGNSCDDEDGEKEKEKKAAS